MTDPVICVGDGHTYEKSAITKWLEKNETSPLTGETLASTQLIPNHSIRKVPPNNASPLICPAANTVRTRCGGGHEVRLLLLLLLMMTLLLLLPPLLLLLTNAGA